MKKVSWMILFFLISSFIVSQNNQNQFDRGIIYYLMKDTKLAREYLNLFFYQKSSFQLRNGFRLLLEAKYWNATTKFKDYLGIDHRSQIGLVGIALSTVNMKNTATIENLKRAIRLNPRFPSAYACLGMEYIKKKNFPVSEGYFKKALRYSNIPEYKILLANLYLKINKPKMALQLMKSEAENYPKNFHYNFLTAQAYYKLDQFESTREYIEKALAIQPKSPEAKLLQAQHLMSLKKYTKAKSILMDFKFESYNEDYVKTLGHTLLELKDRRALNYLYEFFSKKEWDKDINRLMGLYFLKQTKKSNIQNWIYRSILSGNEIELLKQLFPDSYQFPEYQYLSFFGVKQIKWISDTTVLVIATLKSGAREKIFFIDTEKMKIIRALSYQGSFQNFFRSKISKNIIFSTVAAVNERVYLYAIEINGNRFSLRPASRRSLKMAAVLVGFNQQGDKVYITDRNITSLAFESPFSIVSIYGKKKLVYPVYPFPIYQYDFNRKTIFQLKINNQLDQLENIPIRNIQKYAIVCRAYQNNSQISDLIQRGQKFDLTSSKVIKVHFDKDLSAFIIYLSDLKNAFQALIYDELKNRVERVDGTMFLGKERYAAVEICHFNPRRKEIFILTKDKKRDLIEFNYASYLYSMLAKDVNDFCKNPREKMIVVLTERSNNIFYKDTNLELIFRQPFIKNKITSRRNLNKICSCQSNDRICFTTNNGERVRMDDQYKFHYQGVSLKNALHDISPAYDKVSVFVNGRLFVIDWAK